MSLLQSRSFFQRIRSALVQKILSWKRRTSSDFAAKEELIKQIEAYCLSHGFGVSWTQKIQKELNGNPNLWASKSALKEFISQKIQSSLEPLVPSASLIQTKPLVILITGVNGSGKTSTLGKLAHFYRTQGRSVRLIAADTFRLAAVAQLQTWADRANALLVAPSKEGQDPASVVFEGLDTVQEDVVLIDTAGRLHNKSHLMDELGKIKRILQKRNPSFPHETWLVMDGTVGNHFAAQVRGFEEAISPITGLILTKLDNQKTGTLVAQADLLKDLNIPVVWLGTGESMESLVPFSPSAYAASLVDQMSCDLWEFKSV